MSYDSWIGFAGLIVAISGIVLTVALRLYDYRKQGSQRRIDRIGDVVRRLNFRLAEAESDLRVSQESESVAEVLVPEFHSKIQQICRLFYEEIMGKSLQIDLRKESPTIYTDLCDLHIRYKKLENAYWNKVREDPKNQSAHFDEFRKNVVSDSEIKRLIKELIPLMNNWLEKHP